MPATAISLRLRCIGRINGGIVQRCEQAQSELLPRRALLMLDMAANTLENEASYAKEPARVTAMANAIRMTLGLILLGEAHDDRKPGVPRII